MYWTELSFLYVVSGQQSNVVNVRCGIPQGSVPGPTLFVLYREVTCQIQSPLASFLCRCRRHHCLYWVGDTVDTAVMSLNTALSVLAKKTPELLIRQSAKQC